MKKNTTVTAFQQRVYDACLRIPRGGVATYKDVAKAIGCGSARAVGQALRRNPFAPRVPCHRVVRSDLALGGFSGQEKGPEVTRKRRLLAAEGVRFVGAAQIDPACHRPLRGARS